MKNKELQSKIIGTHYIIDFFGCNRQQINSVRFLKQTLTRAISNTDIVLLNNAFYKFDPQGVTGFFLLSTSHISLHSWPEHEYISFDVYTCSNDEMTRKVTDYIIEKIEHKKVFIKNIDRTYNLLKKEPENRVLKLPIYSTGSDQVITVNSKVENIVSAFQQIEIIDTAEFGRSMLIDGVLQTSEKDHVIYDDAILSKLKKTDEHILILGGGDGYVAERALEINPNLKITIIDLDSEVVQAAKKFLNQNVFQHPNVRLCIGDALTYLKTRKEDLVDGIIFDLTDNPAIQLESDYKEDYTHFYQQIIPAAKQHLKEGGWVSLQAGAAKVTDEYLYTAAILKKELKKHFNKVSEDDVRIPSFGEDNCFIFGYNTKK